MMTSTTDHPPLFCAWRAWPRRAFAVCQAALLGALLVLAGCGAGPLITVELSGDSLDQGRLEMALDVLEAKAQIKKADAASDAAAAT